MHQSMAQAKGGKWKRRKKRGRESNKTSLTYRARVCRNMAQSPILPAPYMRIFLYIRVCMCMRYYGVMLDAWHLS
jgi:hypothetical protein